MKKLSGFPWKTIGCVALYVLMGLVSAFFLATFYSSNTYFFSSVYYDAVITPKTLNLSVTVCNYGVIIAVVLMTVVSLVKRRNKTVNKALIWLTGVLALLGMAFFMIMMKLDGLFEIAFENANLYALYFVITALAGALPLFSAIRNLVKLKKAPVTFAKTEQNAKAEEASAEAEPTKPEAE